MMGKIFNQVKKIVLKNQLSAEQKQAIRTFEDGDPNENPWVNGKPEQVHIEVVAHDPDWFARFGVQKELIQKVLGDLALSIDHVGSTAVVGLAAKPIIDIDLIVKNPEDEASYIPALETLGYELTIRELSWYQHRMLKLHHPMVNLHVFGKDCPEHHRHLLFKEWLQTHPEDLADYAAIKEIAKNNVNTMQDYNQKKQDVVRVIYQKIFAAL